MSLPAYQDCRNNFDWWPEKIVTPETIAYTASIAQRIHDLVFIGAFVGMSEEAVAINAEGAADIHEGMEIGTDHITADPLENVFGTVNTEVWVDPVTMLCHDTYLAGRYGVGQLVQVKNADGVITFKKRRYYITAPVVTPTT